MFKRKIKSTCEIEVMKNLKSICFFILLFFNIFNGVFAQNNQPTPYQKKQLELSKKWFQILSGYEMTMSDEVFYEQITAGKEANDFVLGLAILNYAMYNSKAQCEKIFNQMNNEFKQSEKLKNATDFKLENEAKARKEQVDNEKTDYGNIGKSIKYAFEQWNQKDEFEKEIDYIKRLQNQSQTVFNGICLDKIKSKINNLSTYNWEIKLSTYNSEEEFFMVFFKTNGIEWQSKINIPITQAPKFKTDWPDLDFTIDDYDWCFVENSLCPTVVTLENKNDKTKYKFPLTLNNQSEILYSFDKLEIDNQYLKGYVFRYSNVKIIAEQQEREKQRLDSLQLAKYNYKLDSIFKDYNLQLLQNPHNINKKVLPDYEKIKGGNNREYSFSSSLSAIESNFKKLSNSFESEFEYEYRKNGSLFIDKGEFDSFYSSGNEIYISEKEKRDVFNYLKTNSFFIETMDFQNEFSGPAVVNGNLVASPDYTSMNETRNGILSVINKNQNKTYYSQILDFVIETNLKLNKEWSKNGQYFKSKAEFYDAYLTDDYKKILKQNKNK